MHFTWISPIFLYPLYYRPKLGLTILGIFSIASIIIPAVGVVVKNYTYYPDPEKSLREIYYEIFDSFTVTYNQAIPYFVGIFLGYEVANKKRHITKGQVIFNWILTGFLVLCCIRIAYFCHPMAIVYDMVWEVIYATVVRLAWSIAMAWIIYACTQGYGGPLTRFLSLPIFVPLSRLCYGIYLVHCVIQGVSIASTRTAGYFTPFAEMHLVWGDLALSIAGAIVLHLLIEAPAALLAKILTAKLFSNMTERASTQKEEKNSAMIRKSYELTRDKVRCDLAIDTTAEHFWQTVSDVLNELGKRSRKTPAELAKTWKESKFEIMQNHDQRESDAKNIQNVSIHNQTEITTLEQELIVFLAAVICDSDDIENSDKLDLDQWLKSNARITFNKKTI